MSWDFDSFKEKIETEHKFPGPYLFKFIVPIKKKEEVLDILPEGKISFRNSSGKKYISITVDSIMDSSDIVISIYRKAYYIEGLIAL